MTWEFAIGFPPKLLSWKKGETTYSLNVLPIGGFVRIYGEDLTEAVTATTDSDRVVPPAVLALYELTRPNAESIRKPACCASIELAATNS